LTPWSVAVFFFRISDKVLLRTISDLDFAVHCFLSPIQYKLGATVLLIAIFAILRAEWLLFAVTQTLYPGFGRTCRDPCFSCRNRALKTKSDVVLRPTALISIPGEGNVDLRPRSQEGCILSDNFRGVNEQIGLVVAEESLVQMFARIVVVTADWRRSDFCGHSLILQRIFLLQSE
jgi:hypothetical protein